MGNIDYIVVGLGNPGKEYEKTRHNVGFMALDFVIKKLDAQCNKSDFNSISGCTVYQNKKLLFLKPQTYMNLSGQAVFSAMSFYKIPIQKVIVVFDDVSLPMGKFRIRQKGSAGGHNGIKSIINTCGSCDFTRMKIGVGEKPIENWDLANWVLSKFDTSELQALEQTFDNFFDALSLVVKGEISKAMNKLNG